MTNAWFMRGSFAEGRAALTAVLDLAPGGAAPTEFPHVAVWAGVLVEDQGDYHEAERLTLRARDLARDSKNAYVELFADNQLGWLAFVRGDVRRARDVLERTLVTAPTDSPLAQVIRVQLANVYFELGDRARAGALLDATPDGGGSASRLLVGRALKIRAQLADQVGDYVEADRLLDESIAAARAVGDQPGLIESLTLRGIVAIQRGGRDVAIDALIEALEIASLYASKVRLVILARGPGIRRCQYTACGVCAVRGPGRAAAQIAWCCTFANRTGTRRSLSGDRQTALGRPSICGRLAGRSDGAVGDEPT